NADLADRDFHLGVAKATHNSALVSVVRNLWDQGRGAIWKRMERHFQTPEMRAAALGEHRAILTALEGRDGSGARAAMRGHLERVDREFERGWDLLKERAQANPREGAASAGPASGDEDDARSPAFRGPPVPAGTLRTRDRAASLRRGALAPHREPARSHRPGVVRGEQALCRSVVLAGHSGPLHLSDALQPGRPAGVAGGTACRRRSRGTGRAQDMATAGAELAPLSRDPVADVADACAERGLRRGRAADARIG